MACFNPECVGNSDFERILFFAQRRFVEGIDTITLMTEARDEQERRDIALAALLDLDEEHLERLNLFVCDNHDCKAGEYRARLKKILADADGVASGF